MSHVQETATAHKTKCFRKTLLVVTSTAVISLYKQLTGECGAPSTSHIKLGHIAGIVHLIKK